MKKKFNNNFTQTVKEMLKSQTSEMSKPKTEEAIILTNGADEAIQAIQESHKSEIEEIIEAPKCIQHSILAKGVIITGNIQCEGIIDLNGIVTGDIHGGDELKITGKLNGNVEGKNVEINEGVMVGNINASGAVTISRNSHLTGDINAKDLTVNGTIHGDVTLKNNLMMEEHGVIIGKIQANQMAVDDGALVQGEVAIRSNNLPDRAWTEEI